MLSLIAQRKESVDLQLLENGSGSVPLASLGEGMSGMAAGGARADGRATGTVGGVAWAIS